MYAYVLVVLGWYLHEQFGMKMYVLVHTGMYQYILVHSRTYCTQCTVTVVYLDREYLATLALALPVQ
jgi:hypothetical protein